MLYKPYIDIKLTENWENHIDLDYAWALSIIKSFYLHFSHSLQPIPFSASRWYPSSQSDSSARQTAWAVFISFMIFIYFIFIFTSSVNRVFLPTALRRRVNSKRWGLHLNTYRKQRWPFLLQLLKTALERINPPNRRKLSCPTPNQLLSPEKAAAFGELILTALWRAKSYFLLQRNPSQHSCQHFQVK